MENQVNTAKTNKTPIALAVMTVLSGLLTSILFQTGILLLPITAGLLASVFLRESYTKRRLTFILPIILIISDLIFCGIYSLNCLFSVLLACVIYLCFVKWRSKGELAVYSTVLITAALFVSFILVGFFMTGKFSITAVREYYVESLELIRSEFIKAFSSLAMENTKGEVEYIFTKQDLEILYDAFIKSMPSCFAVISFALSGVALKLFCEFGVKRSTYKERITGYTFATPNLFVYFYVFLVLVSFFVSEQDTTFAILISNLYTVFLYVYAYLGYKYISEILSIRTGKPRLTSFLVLVAVIFFAGFAIQLLSLMGVFLTVLRNKAIRYADGGEDE